MLNYADCDSPTYFLNESFFFSLYLSITSLASSSEHSVVAAATAAAALLLLLNSKCSLLVNRSVLFFSRICFSYSLRHAHQVKKKKKVGCSALRQSIDSLYHPSVEHQITAI